MTTPRQRYRFARNMGHNPLEAFLFAAPGWFLVSAGLFVGLVLPRIIVWVLDR